MESLDEILFDQRPAFFPRLVELTFGLDYVLTHVVVGRDEQPFLEETAGNDIISKYLHYFFKHNAGVIHFLC